MVTEQELTAIFSEAFPGVRIEACFAPLTQVKAQWQRAFDWITFRVSDYLEDAPAEALREFAEILRADTRGEEHPKKVALLDYLTSPEFSQNHRATFIERMHLTKDEDGSLEVLRNTLKEKGLYPEGFDDVELVWSEFSIGVPDKCRSSVLMRLVSVPIDYKDRLTDPVVVKGFYEAFSYILAGYDAKFGAYETIVRKWRD